MVEKEWALPEVAGVALQLTKEEALLVLWVIGAAANLVPREELHQLRWADVRAYLWRALPAYSGDNDVRTFDLKTLLYADGIRELQAYVPITFRWGTGQDVGYSLSDKLAHYIRGEQYVHDPVPQAAPTQTPTNSYVDDD